MAVWRGKLRPRKLILRFVVNVKSNLYSRRLAVSTDSLLLSLRYLRVSDSIVHVINCARVIIYDVIMFCC